MIRVLKSLAICCLILLACLRGHAQATDKQGYAPKVSSFGNLFNQLRSDSAQHIPHKYALTQNTTDSTPQLFAWSTTSGDSLILFVNGVYHIIGVGNAVANVGGAISMQSGTFTSMPLAGTYGRFYATTDSSRLYFDNGTDWVNLSNGGFVKPAPEIDTLITSMATVRDTSINFGSCGVQECGYIHFSFPQYAGFGVRLYSGGGLIAQGLALACIFGINVYTWDSSTGDMYIWGVAGPAGSTNSYFQITPYY